MGTAVSRPLASPGLTGRWLRALPRLCAVCAGLLVLNLGCVLMTKGLDGWSLTLVKSLAITVGLPIIGLVLLRWDPNRWFNIGVGTGFFAAAVVVVAAHPQRHGPPGWVPVMLAVGALVGWPVGLAFRHAGRMWLDPLDTDLAERPIRLLIRLDHSAGRLTVHPSGLRFAVEPANEFVVAAEPDAAALLRWAQIARVESGVLQVGARAGRALRVVLASGGQVIVPTAQADPLAAICAVRSRAMTQSPATVALKVRLAFAEIYARNPRTSVRLPFMAGQALVGCIALWQMATTPVGGTVWLVLAGAMLVMLVQQCREVRSMMLELTRMREEAEANAGRAPSVAAPPGWRADPAQASYQRPLYN